MNICEARSGLAKFFLQVGIDIGVAAGGVAVGLVGTGENTLRGAEAILDLRLAAVEGARYVVTLGAKRVAIGEHVVVHE